MDEELLQPHPCTFLSQDGSSNEEPAFGRAEVHIGEHQVDPFPMDNISKNYKSELYSINS